MKYLDRFVTRFRPKPLHADEPSLWLSRKGRFTSSGIEQMVRDRGVLAWRPNCHSHRFRHSFANVWLAADQGQTGLMALLGWRSRDMLQRYARANQATRAIAAARRSNPGHRL